MTVAPGEMVGVEARVLALLVYRVVTELSRENLTVTPLTHDALMDALFALDLDTDLSSTKNFDALRELVRS